jgi:hypothetical protein
VKVYVDVGTFMHSELLTCNDYHALLDTGDMCWPGDGSAEQKGGRDGVDGQTGKWAGDRAGYREIENATIQFL